MPCSTRKPVSSATFELIAHNTEAAVNTAIADRNTSRTPKRWVTQPLSGISTASVSR